MLKTFKKIIKKLYSVLIKSTKQGILWVESKDWKDGYDDEKIIQKVRLATKNVKDGIYPYERDSVNFNEPVYQESFIISIREAVKEFGDKIRVLDFGGALGSHYYCYSEYPEFKNVDFTWIVIEQEKFVEIGREEFEDKNLKFKSRIDEAVKIYGNPDLIIASGVFMYIEKYQKYLKELLNIRSRFLLIARNFVDQNLEKSIITTQYVPEEIYKAEYPCYIFSEDFYQPIIDTGYIKVFDLPSIIDGCVQKYSINNNIKEFNIRDTLFKCI